MVQYSRTEANLARPVDFEKVRFIVSGFLLNTQNLELPVAVDFPIANRPGIAIGYGLKIKLIEDLVRKHKMQFING